MRMSCVMAAVLVAAGWGLNIAAKPAQAGETPAARNSYLYIGWPNNGEVIRRGRFRVWFGLRNMGIAPAQIKKRNTGHHHLIVDAALPPFDKEIPSDKKHLHFGGGQSEMVLELPPGKHTLQLIMGDHDHVPHDPPVYSRKITVTVK